MAARRHSGRKRQGKRNARPAKPAAAAARRAKEATGRAAANEPAGRADGHGATGGQVAPGMVGRLFQPVDSASLAFFRIAFGAIMVWEVVRYFANGWIYANWIEPRFFFTYYGFDWVQPWPGNGMYWHFVVLGIAALYIALGLLYRLATVVFFLAFTYVFLLDQSTYLNHFYLIVLISLLMVVMPANRCFSLDARFKPKLRSDVIPAWPVYLLRAQLALVYFFAGIAKLNADWLRGEPMRMWLARRTDFPLVGPLFDEEPVVYFASYGALVLDLLAAPLLLWRRTRAYAFAAVVTFHLLNSQLFQIGIFPWLMIPATTLFFDPGWPRRVLSAVRRRLAAGVAGWRLERVAGRESPEPGESKSGGSSSAARMTFGRLTGWQRAGLALAGLYLAIQVVMPLRHFAYPGSVHWTEEGHRFAWHMKLRDKKARGIRFWATDSATGRTWVVDPRRYLTTEQLLEMSREPEMLLLFSHYIADRLRRAGIARPRVHAWVPVSLNGRRHQLLLDPRVDLAAQRRSLAHADWILPLEPPRYP